MKAKTIFKGLRKRHRPVKFVQEGPRMTTMFKTHKIKRLM